MTKQYKTRHLKQHRRQAKINKGDVNDLVKQQEDNMLFDDKKIFDKNYDEIDWSKGRKKDSKKAYKVRPLKGSTRKGDV